MGRLQTWGAAARRSRLFQVVAAVVVVALVAGGIVLVTRSAAAASAPLRHPSRPEPSPWGIRSPTATGWPTPT